MPQVNRRTRLAPILLAGLALFSTAAVAETVKGTPTIPPMKAGNKDKVSSKIKSKRADIAACYKKESGKKAKGKITLEFNIVEGKTKDVKVTGLSPTMHACTRKAVEQWIFKEIDQNANGVKVEYLLQP